MVVVSEGEVIEVGGGVVTVASTAVGLARGAVTAVGDITSIFTDRAVTEESLAEVILIL